jgi:hypothetical protein
MVVTNNRKDFKRLHNAGHAHKGIVVYTLDVDFEALAHRIDSALSDLGSRQRPLISVTRAGHEIL